MIRRPKITMENSGILVNDLHRSIDFYCRVLGFETGTGPTRDDSQSNTASLRIGGAELKITSSIKQRSDLKQSRENSGDMRANGTTSIKVSTPDLGILHEYLASVGVDGLTDMYWDIPSYRHFFFRDPDGITIEAGMGIEDLPFIRAIQFSGL